MEIVYHPLVRSDVEEPLTYYRNVSARLADEFHAELRAILDQAAETRCGFTRRTRASAGRTSNDFPAISSTKSTPIT